MNLPEKFKIKSLFKDVIPHLKRIIFYEINLPKIKLPNVNFKKPQINLPSLVIKLPVIKLPAFNLSKFSLPEFKPPKFNMPKIKLPVISFPKINFPALNLPRFSLPKLTFPNFKISSFNPKLKTKRSSKAGKFNIININGLKRFLIKKINFLQVKLPKVKLPQVSLKFKLPVIKLPAFSLPKFNILLRSRIPLRGTNFGISNFIKLQSVEKMYMIGEAAKAVGVSISTIRRWDKAGKIKIGRKQNKYRAFTLAEIELLKQSQAPSGAWQSQIPVNSIKQNFAKHYSTLSKASLKLRILTVLVLILVIVFSSGVTYQTGLKKVNNVLGIETVAISALEEGGSLGNVLSQAGKIAGGFANIFKSSQTWLSGSFVISILEKSKLSTGGDLKVTGKGTFAKDIEGLGNLKIKGTATVGKLKTGIVDPYLIENDGLVQPTLEIRSTGDIKLESGTFNVDLGGSSLSNVNNITSTGAITFNNLTITNNSTIGGTLTTTGAVTVGTSLETKKDLTVDGNITLTGVINSNTFTSTKLVFAGDSPAIAAGTSATALALDAGTTGAVNIASSSTGDINLGGGSSSTGCTVTNSNGNFNCAGNITASSDLVVNGGDVTSSATTFNFLTSTVTTLNIGGNSTSVSIPGLSFTKAPTLAHTGTWAINSSTWNISDSTLYVNPASATADSNLLGLAVAGSVKFAVDAEGDIYGNNLVLTGNTTTGTTTVSGDLSVEGNTILGDATTDTITLNPATLTWAGGNKTIDITGAATRTLTLLNSTSAQVADLNLSDGSLYTGGTQRLDNSGNLSNIGTLSMSGQLTSTLANGTAPFVVASSTNVANLNASSLNGATFAAPGAIGGGTAGAGTFTTLTGNTSITDGGLTTAGVVTNTSGGVLGTLAGTTTTVLHGNAAGAPTFAAITGSDLDPAITISTTGNISTTGTGTITSAGLLTASNGLTLTTGALSLTGTSGSIALTGFGTTSITSTTTTGDVIAATDTSLNTAAANLSNFTFKNNNTAAAGLAVNGVTITEQSAAAPLSGTNTSNLINLVAAVNGTVNGVNISSATGFTNFIKTPTFNLDSSGNVTGVVGLTATTLTGAISTASQTNITAVGTLGSLAVTGNINSTTGSLQTNSVTRIDNSGNISAGTGAFSGTVTVGSGTGKIDVGTVDPPYTIGGEKYATYLPSITGVKEETSGTIKLDQTGKYEIDFSKATKGSDLWLFYQVTDFGKNWENLTVLLTPSFDGRVWYVKDPLNKKITVFGSSQGEVSYRFTASRFDYANWSNMPTEGSAGFIIPVKK